MADNENGSFKMHDPETFDGTKKEARSFLRSIKQYIRVKADKFKKEEEKIIWAMSYMPKGEAARFADRIYNEYIDLNKTLTFKEWEEKFKDQFMSADFAKDAMVELTKLEQGTNAASDYNNQFRALMLEAGVTDNLAIRNIYRTNLNTGLAGRMTNLVDMPETLEEWMTITAQLDKQWRHYRELRPEPKTRSFQPFRPKKKFGRSRAMLTEKEKEDYRKAGKCFSCGQIGHRSFECPNKDKGKARATIAEEEPQSAKAKLRQMLQEVSKEDIMELLEQSDNEDF